MLTSADLLPETRFWIFEGRVLHIKVTGKVLFSLRNADCQAYSREQFAAARPLQNSYMGVPVMHRGRRPLTLMWN